MAVSESSVSLSNRDQRELDKFDQLAMHWWDAEGDCQPLHEINPLRLEWIRSHIGLDGLEVVDVGCGGGILSESLARSGARVLGIDLANSAIDVARQHAADNQLDIEYRSVAAETLAAERPGEFDVVTCLEMLEHVPDPAAVVRACSGLVKPGGLVFFSTINRNRKAYAHAIIAAERLLRLLPRGTHDFERFIRPSELAAYARQASLDVLELRGLGYNPLTRRYHLQDDISVNYLAACRRLEMTDLNSSA